MSKCIVGCQYMPSVEFFAHWYHHEIIHIESQETYQKRTWRNKTAILGSDGPLFMSVPLRKGKHHGMLIQEVGIAYDQDWHRAHFNSLKTAYGKTAFYDEVESGLEEILFSGEDKLWNMNLAILQYLVSLLRGSWPFTFTNEYIAIYESPVKDLRSGIAAGNTSVHPDSLPVYEQVLRLEKSHIPNLSILDVLCHKGPEAREYIAGYADQLYRQS